MQQRGQERSTPGVADDLRTDDDVAELARHPFRQLVARIDRERERVGRLVAPQWLAPQRAALVRSDERDAELARIDSFAREHASRELACGMFVDVDAGPVADLDLDNRARGSAGS